MLDLNDINLPEDSLAAGRTYQVRRNPGTCPCGAYPCGTRTQKEKYHAKHYR